MSRRRFVQRPTFVQSGLPFESAEEAWLWATHATRYARDGANLTANQSVMRRPCEPRDVINLACRSRREGRLSGYEFGVLCRFGALDRPPDPRDVTEAQDAVLWDRALDTLIAPMRVRGIVAVSDNENWRGFENQLERNKK